MATLLDTFLDWVKANRAARTDDWYVMFLSEFAKSIRNLSIKNLKPHHVEKWSRQYVSNSTRHGAIRSVQRCFNWAIKQGYLTKSPLVGIEKPTPSRREAYVSGDQWEELLEREKNENTFWQRSQHAVRRRSESCDRRTTQLDWQNRDTSFEQTFEFLF
ncbi:MAG: hypothetical protein CMJ64_25540 [Planctomycetaceae bacterium]|nr:hypothetical protein [Planctomycetaceae bacterium]